MGLQELKKKSKKRWGLWSDSVGGSTGGRRGKMPIGIPEDPLGTGLGAEDRSCIGQRASYRKKEARGG